MWQYAPSGIKFVNGLVNTTLLNVISGYLKLQCNEMVNTTETTTHEVHIENFKTCGRIERTYAIDLQQSHSNVDVSVTLLNSDFKNEFALLIRHVDSLGQTRVTVANCNFTEREFDIHGYFNPQYENCELIDDCFMSYDAMIYVYFEFYNTTNKIQFISCTFVSNSQPNELIHSTYMQKYVNSETEGLIVLIINCLFNENHYMRLISIVSFNNEFQNRYVSLLIKNVTISSQINNGQIEAIIANKVTLYIENVKFISNSFTNPYFCSIIVEKESYVQFSGYNEFSHNSAAFAISTTSAIYLQENTVLNFTLNTFYHIILPEHPVTDLATDDIKMCIIQYISERGNLDTDFWQEKPLNYSVSFTENIMHGFKIQSKQLMHCAWDTSSAFSNSIPFQVNQRFIIGNNFTIEEDKKQVCLCTNNGTLHCYNGIVGPFYPGQTVILKFALRSTSLKYAAHIEIKRSYSNFACDKDKLRLLKLEVNECKLLEYTIKHTGKWCELILIATPLDILHDLGIPVQSYTLSHYNLVPKGSHCIHKDIVNVIPSSHHIYLH